MGTLAYNGSLSGAEPSAGVQGAEPPVGVGSPITTVQGTFYRRVVAADSRRM